MKSKTNVSITLLFIVLLLALAACGKSQVALADIPAYTGASLLEAGQDPIADTLIQNMEQDAGLRDDMGVGGSIEQIAYRLPEGTTWEQVKSFYDKELDAAGWESGMGGPGGDLAGSIMASVSADNPLFQTAIWSQGKQTLTLVRNVNPTNEAEVYLIMSLNTN